MAGCLLGGIYSLIILLDLNTVELTLIKVFMGVSLVFVVFFHLKKKRSFLKSSLYFFLVNFIFCGFMSALWLFASPPGMSYKNGIAYFNISALNLAVSTIAAYLIICAFTYFFNRRNRKEELLEIRIGLNGRETELKGFADTGNKLIDIFTGLPVIIAEYESIASILPEKTRLFYKNPTEYKFEEIEGLDCQKMLKMIPVNAVSGEGSLPAFRPDSIIIEQVKRTAIVAVTNRSISDGSFQAIINTSLLS